jgi:alanine dehydrogenase
MGRPVVSTPSRLLVLRSGEVGELLEEIPLLDVLASALVDLSLGRASCPDRAAASAGERGLLFCMPAFGGGALGAKLVSLFEENHSAGLPSHQALVVLFDAGTGLPAALLDGTEVTTARTAAVSALATSLLAAPGARVLAVLGAGVQGAAHLRALTRLAPFADVRVASRNPEHARALAREQGCRWVPGFEEAVRGADVVCACTSSPVPVLSAGWLGQGAHLNSIGPWELDPETVAASRLAVESRAAAFRAYPVGAGDLAGADPDAAVELGEILAGHRPGRRSASELTLFKSVGVGVEDAAVARAVYERALERGAGRLVAI